MDIVDGRETVGKAWESSVGMERDGSVDIVDGEETVENSLGELPGKEATY